MRARARAARVRALVAWPGGVCGDPLGHVGGRMISPFPLGFVALLGSFSVLFDATGSNSERK